MFMKESSAPRSNRNSSGPPSLTHILSLANASTSTSNFLISHSAILKNYFLVPHSSEMLSRTKILLAGNTGWPFLATGAATGPLSHHHSKQENRTQLHWQKSLKHTDILCLEIPEILSINVKTFIYGNGLLLFGALQRKSVIGLFLCVLTIRFYSKEGKMVLKQIHMSEQVTRQRWSKLAQPLKRSSIL